MKIYTGFGDEGRTALFGGEVVSKNHLRVEVYGTLDELNSIIGLLVVKVDDRLIKERLNHIQYHIFAISSEIATPDSEKRERFEKKVSEEDVAMLERHIDDFSEPLPDIKNFILPGGSETAALAHLARTVCRRAERRLVAWHETEPARREILIYLNRLSDLFFILARYQNHRNEVKDVLWKGRL